MASPTWIDLLRHGEPEGGPRFRGRRDDPLSDLGWQQMRAATEGDAPWQVIITSPLQRCQQFATQLSQQLGLPLHAEPRLQEISFGEWEGSTAETIQARWGRRLSDYWSDPVAHPPPGAEPFADFRLRVLEAWHHWQQTLSAQHSLWVCHGGVIRVLVGEAMGVPPQKTLGALHVPYACRSRLRVDESGFGTLTCLISHGR